MAVAAQQLKRSTRSKNRGLSPVKSGESGSELNRMFNLMGWANLPDPLKDEIVFDVATFVNELKGNYSTIDPAIDKRRKRVTYWINAYRDGICTLDTAITGVRE